MQSIEVSTLLADFPIFGTLEKKEIEQVSPYFHYRKISKNDHIFRQGEDLQAIYFLCKGRVKIYKINACGREQLVTVNNHGETFPHVGYFFDKKIYPANALVLIDAQLLYIPIHKLEELLSNHHKISIIFLKILGEKLTELQGRLEEKLLDSTYQQVIKLLLRLSVKHGVKLSNGDMLFLTPFQHKELASIIGTSRETISRMMNRLESQRMTGKDSKGRLIIKSALLEIEI